MGKTGAIVQRSCEYCVNLIIINNLVHLIILKTRYSSPISFIQKDELNPLRIQASKGVQVF